MIPIPPWWQMWGGLGAAFQQAEPPRYEPCGLPLLIDDFPSEASDFFQKVRAARHGYTNLPGALKVIEPERARCLYCGTDPGHRKSCDNCGAPT